MDSRRQAVATEMRDTMVDRLVDGGAVRSAEVDAAMRSVPREAFLRDAPLVEAYADQPVYVKFDGQEPISAASQPRAVAAMLEHAEVRAGHRVLEVGTGTGYNAALLARLVGPTGQVFTVEVDPDLAAKADMALAKYARAPYEVVCADGALGCPSAAPFDRVVSTVGVHEIPPAWLDQVAPGGRLVVPVRLAGSVSRSIAFERGDGGWVDAGSERCTFMPMRGRDARTMLDVGEAVTLRAFSDNEIDPATFRGVLDRQYHEAETSTMFVRMESWEWLQLWLACTMPGSIMELLVEPHARRIGAVHSNTPSTALAVSDGEGNLAYLTYRQTRPGADGEERFEVVAVGHGSPKLVQRLATFVWAWDRVYRERRARFVIPDGPVGGESSTDRAVLSRPSTPMCVTWEWDGSATIGIDRTANTGGPR